jgi:hypothetical protein
VRKNFLGRMSVKNVVTPIAPQRFSGSRPATLPAVTAEFIASLEHCGADRDRLYQIWANGTTAPEIAKLLRLNGREENSHRTRCRSHSLSAGPVASKSLYLHEGAVIAAQLIGGIRLSFRRGLGRESLRSSRCGLRLRATPDGDQVDLVELTEIAEGRIQSPAGSTAAGWTLIH